MPVSDEGLKNVSYRVLIGLAAFIVVVAGMRAAQDMIVPFLLAVFISIISAPLLTGLQRRGLPTWLSLIVAIIAVFALVVGIVAIVGGSLDGFSRELPVYQEKLVLQIDRLVNWLASLGIHVSRDTFLAYLNPGSAMALASTMLKGLGGVLTNAFLILLTVIFILLEVSTFSDKFRAALGSPDSSLEHFRLMLDNVKRYMGIKTLTSALTGIIVGSALLFLDVDFAVLWGFLAFLFNFIPNIGSIIAAVPAVLIALLQLGPTTALIVSVIYLVVNTAVGSMLEPRLMGHRLGLSPLVVFVSLVFWGWVLGPVGMFLSVPLTITVQIVLDSNSDSRWLAVLLGPGVRPNETA